MKTDWSTCELSDLTVYLHKTLRNHFENYTFSGNVFFWKIHLVVKEKIFTNKEESSLKAIFLTASVSIQILMSTNKKATSIEIWIDLYRSGFICTDMAKKITFKLGSSLVNYFLHQKHHGRICMLRKVLHLDVHTYMENLVFVWKMARQYLFWVYTKLWKNVPCAQLNCAAMPWHGKGHILDRKVSVYHVNNFVMFLCSIRCMTAFVLHSFQSYTSKVL